MPSSSSSAPVARWFKHPWHLIRCGHCRKMILNSAPKCPHCATWQSSARGFSFGFPALALSSLLALAIMGAVAYVNSSDERAAEREAQTRERLIAIQEATRAQR